METARRAIAEACGAAPDGPGSPRLSLPLHPRLPGRPGALLHGALPGAARRRGRAVGRDQGGGLGDRDRRRRDDHPPPRGRPRPPALVRPPAPRPFAEALRAAKRARRPRGRAQPGGADRPLTSYLPAWRRSPRSGVAPLPGEPEPPVTGARRSLAGARAARGDAAAGVDQEPARLRRPAVLAEARRGPRRSSTRLITFAAFCAISSAGYLFNDLRDARSTAAIPRSATARSPAASCRAGVAVVAAVALAVVRDWARAARDRLREVAGLVALYGVTTIAYSLVLKRLVILDVMTIASLFILRVVAGAVAVEAHASECLLLCTAMLALFLGFTKRRQEAMSESMPAASSSRSRGDRSGEPDRGRGRRPGRCSSTTRCRSSTRWSRWSPPRRSSATRSTPSTAR